MTTGESKLGGVRAAGKAAHESDIALFDTIEKTFYTAVLADALDELGEHERAMREYLRPLLPDKTFAGWARTIVCMDAFYQQADPYGLEIEALDSILPGEVVAVSTGESKRNAPWGSFCRPRPKRGGQGVQSSTDWCAMFVRSRNSIFRYSQQV